MKAPAFDVELYPPFNGFPKQALEFFKKLKRNNNRPWFEKHKHEYEEFAKAPMQSLLATVQSEFAEFAPEFDMNPQRAIFRIYRDIRFSKDKTPFKTHIAAHAVLRGMPKGFLGSGYYFHVDPDECFVGGGIYMPDGDQLKKIRSAVANRGKDFLAIVNDKRFKKRFGKIGGEKLQRIPKGYDESHPMAEWLKFKQFFVGVSLPGTACLKVGYTKTVVTVCQEAYPLVKFLNEAVR